MTTAAGLAPEELLEAAYKTLAKDRARLSGTNYTPYRGKTVSPMSSLTQKARELREQTASKPAPYSKRMEKVLGRENQGLAPENIQSLLGMLSSGHKGLEVGSLKDLARQFQSSPAAYAPERFSRKSGQDLGRGITEATGSLKDLGKAFGTTEGARQLQVAQSLKGLQANKQDRRKALAGNLEQFGNQRHAYNNKALQAAKSQFEEERDAPQKRMAMLEEALQRARGGIGEGAHPDLQKSQAQEVVQALRAYGIDPSKPVDQWDSSRTAPGTYKGKLVADFNPDLARSHSVLERLSPSLKDTYSPKRKALVKELVDNPNISGQALRDLPESIRGSIEQLDHAAKQRRKKDLAEISNRYVKLGTYGSSQHRTDSENRIRELNRSALEERNKLIRAGLTNQFALKHDKDIGAIRKLDALGAAGQKEYADLFGGIRQLNKLGATKFGNEQDENEELYKNYQNQGLWEWPHMRNAIRSGARGEIFQGLADRNIGLDQLAALNTRYSETERDRNALRTNLATERAQWKRDRTSLRGELRTVADARDALQSQVETSEKAAKQAARKLAREKYDAESAAKLAADNARFEAEEAPRRAAAVAQQAEQARLLKIQATMPRDPSVQFFGSLPTASSGSRGTVYDVARILGGSHDYASQMAARAKQYGYKGV